MNRRRFLAFLPGLVAAPAVAQQVTPPPARVDRLRLDCAESLMGLDFNEAEEAMALRSVNQNLESYEELRKLNVPLDTEPAITFQPYLPGKRPAGKSTPGAKLRVSKPAVPANLTPEQIAFLPVTSLAALIESKRMTSTELTKLYLDRLKAHGPKLNAVITLTEELALKQAAQADAEIKAGKYRGPLHGIPWGAKDLLAAKNYKTTWGADTLQGSDDRSRRDRRAAAHRGGRRARREALDGRAGTGRRVVRRIDEEPVEHRSQLQRILRRPGLRNRRRTRRLRHRHRNARLDHLSRRPPTASSDCGRRTVG